MDSTRFAPSPTGNLHLGHAFSALFAYQRGEKFRLRIEDLDSTRSRVQFERQIIDDLTWLGLSWQESPQRQSERKALYKQAFEKLEALDLVYPCFCSRRDIMRELANLQAAPHDFDRTHYPGTCRHLDSTESRMRMEAGEPAAWRLHVEKAMHYSGPLHWHDREEGTFVCQANLLGDVILMRKDTDTAAYHLAVVVDDASQGISLITRGQDLLKATHLHRLLQALLDLPVPTWHHHRLIRDRGGRRLAKRSGARSLISLREKGLDAGKLRAFFGFGW